jgi:hypothetical protein
MSEAFVHNIEQFVDDEAIDLVSFRSAETQHDVALKDHLQIEGSKAMESATFRKWLTERGCRFDRHEHEKRGEGQVIVTVHREGRKAEVPLGGSHQILDARVVRQACEELGLGRNCQGRRVESEATSCCYLKQTLALKGRDQGEGDVYQHPDSNGRVGTG